MSQAPHRGEPAFSSPAPHPPPISSSRRDAFSDASPPPPLPSSPSPSSSSSSSPPLWRCACWLQSQQSSQSLGSGQRIYSGAWSWTAGEDSKPPPSIPPHPIPTLFHLLCKKEEKGEEKALLITVNSSLDMKISHCAGSWWLLFVLRISFFFLVQAGIKDREAPMCR